MTEDRFRFFQKMNFEDKMQLTPEDFTTSEFKYILGEMMIKEDCKEIAVMHYIECLSYDEIAYRLGIDRKTVIRRLDKLITRFRFTCVKLFFKLEA